MNRLLSLFALVLLALPSFGQRLVGPTEPYTLDLGDVTMTVRPGQTIHSWDPNFGGFQGIPPSNTYPKHEWPQYNGTLTSMRVGIKLGHSRDRDVTQTGTHNPEAAHYSWDGASPPTAGDQGTTGVSYFAAKISDGSSVGGFSFTVQEFEPVHTVESSNGTLEEYLYTYSHARQWSASITDSNVLAEYEGTGVVPAALELWYREALTYTHSPTVGADFEYDDLRFLIEYNY